MFKRIFQLIGKRVITVYLAIYIVSLFFVDYAGVIHKFRIQTLNRIRPQSFNYLADTMENNERFDLVKLRSYANYYLEVTKVIEDRADAYGLLGFCYYHLGEVDKAIAAYKEAIKINPNFFWSHYNLAVLYFKSQQYELARESIIAALRLDLNNSMMFIYNSQQLYLPLVAQAVKVHNIEHPEDFVFNQLQDGFRNGYIIWVLCHFHMNDYPSMFKAANIALETTLQKKAILNYYAGLAAYNMKEYAVALNYFEASLREDPQLADGYYYLGESAKALGQEKIATVAQIRTEMLKGSPNFTDLRKMEEGLDLKLY